MRLGRFFLAALGFASIIGAQNTALASLDSVGVFHRPEKVVVLVSERGANTRLMNWMNAWSSERSFEILSEDESIRIQCGTNELLTTTCTFRLLPSRFVSIEKGSSGKTADFDISLQNINREPLVHEFSMSFESSENHRFQISIENGILKALASKP